ncbi:MAG: TIGR00159 family protein [Actinobacteria bacterium]|nr:TIGR00159 family protein [Actinomycetota bacterium]
MSTLLLVLQSGYSAIVGVLDFCLVYWIVYRLLVWLKQTHAFNLIKGFFLIMMVFLASHFLGLQTIKWMMGELTTVLIILVIIIFQPELRRFLERVGALERFVIPSLESDQEKQTLIVKHILKAVSLLSTEKIGALIVIENRVSLGGYMESGIPIQSVITSDLLATLFFQGTPTHDGAVIIRKNRIESAGCFLPLSDMVDTDRRLGTRHRAALGLSEVSDSVIVVVSEETGDISLVENGEMARSLDEKTLEFRLFSIYHEGVSEQRKASFGVMKERLRHFLRWK